MQLRDKNKRKRVRAGLEEGDSEAPLSTLEPSPVPVRAKYVTCILSMVACLYVYLYVCMYL